MSDLVNLMNQVVATDELANRDLSEWPDPRTLTGVRGAQRQAQEDLVQLTARYKKALATSISKVFVVADTSTLEKSEALDAVLRELQDAKKAIVVFGDDLYSQIAVGVDKTVDHRTRIFNNFQAGRLVQELTEFARANGIEQLPMPKLDTNLIGTTVPTLQDTLNVVRQAIRAGMDDDLNKIILEREVLAQAVKGRRCEDVVPVFIAKLTGPEIKALSVQMFPGTKSVVVDLAAIPAGPKFQEQALAKLLKECE